MDSAEIEGVLLSRDGAFSRFAEGSDRARGREQSLRGFPAGIARPANEPAVFRRHAQPSGRRPARRWALIAARAAPMPPAAHQQCGMARSTHPPRTHPAAAPARRSDPGRERHAGGPIPGSRRAYRLRDDDLLVLDKPTGLVTANPTVAGGANMHASEGTGALLFDLVKLRA